MNPILWLTNFVIAYTAYSLGRFITIRNLRIAANSLMAEIESNSQKQQIKADKIATQAIADNQTGTPIGASLAREMRIEL